MNRRFKREVAARLGSLAVILAPVLLIVLISIIARRLYGLEDGAIFAIVILAVAWVVAAGIFVADAWNGNNCRNSPIIEWIDEPESKAEPPKDPKPLF
jgi:hypothetical protein